MASKACASCLRTFQRNPRSIPQTRKPLTFTTTRSFTRHDIFQGELPEPNATPALSIPPVTPQRAEGAAKSSSAPLSTKAAAELRKFAGKATETYTAYGTTEALYKACAELADYSIPQARDLEAEMPKTDDGEDLGVGSGWWHTKIGLQPTFSTWSQVTMLHMYFLAARFRCFDASESQIWQQHLLDHFFYDAENRMVINHNMHARGTRNKYLKDMFIQWRGLIAAYDEGVMQGDAVLAAAVWRNIFKANEEVDVRILATIVSYMRKSLKMLEAATDHDVSIGQLKFCNPNEEAKLVLAPSPMLKLPFKKAPGAPAAPHKTPKKA